MANFVKATPITMEELLASSLAQTALAKFLIEIHD
jgi:hypothetical protein